MSLQYTLGQKQREFCIDIANLIVWAYSQGYQFTFGQALRSAEESLENQLAGKGISNSLHKIGLAIDLNLFLDTDNDGDLDYAKLTELHRPIGEYWESMREGNCWGGRFRRPDGNHYSRTHEGRR